MTVMEDKIFFTVVLEELPAFSQSRPIVVPFDQDEFGHMGSQAVEKNAGLFYGPAAIHDVSHQDQPPWLMVLDQGQKGGSALLHSPLRQQGPRAATVNLVSVMQV